jgi:thymidylate kinase
LVSSPPLLVVIVGPIASGKSTVAASLGASLRRNGRHVAVLDLDDVVDSVGGFADLTPEHFHRAQVVFGQLVRCWLDQDVDVVAHGPFVSSDEDAVLVQALPPGIRPRRVLLTTTRRVAFERVAADPERQLSKFPDVLDAMYERFEELLPSMAPAEWTFDTTAVDAERIVEQLGRALLDSGPSVNH